eukprot:CAMPEP_0202917274 /NCGR_PEP_ID=MMETSP1392-20130828/70613_1 /ASSEMBLY_ACC=CAM_ASM_000868 /TAXON_ID=225041 /ORGANISM="Chlamydomonas chlamydogama, Strain SAG 11-48b" /LENGTH=38 /DNA_ID= /DNA_START= /DNA_END= /DNA_ORIENTATION=
MDTTSCSRLPGGAAGTPSEPTVQLPAAAADSDAAGGLG